MKIIEQVLKVSCITALCGMLLQACISAEPQDNPEPEPETPETLDPATV